MNATWFRQGRRAAVAALLVVGLGAAGCADRPRGTAKDPTVGPAGSDSIAREVPVEVAPGDTWASISERFFGDASRAERIAADSGAAGSVSPRPGSRAVVRIFDEDTDRVRRMAEARGPYNAGVEHMQTRGEEAQARVAFERALERAPFFVDARYNLGLALIQLGEPDEARDHLQRVVRERPADKDARYGLAAAYFHAGDYPRAIPELEAALALDPGFLRARWTHALALQRSGRVAEAQQAWQAYLERDASSSWADQARRHLSDLGS